MRFLTLALILMLSMFSTAAPYAEPAYCQSPTTLSASVVKAAQATPLRAEVIQATLSKAACSGCGLCTKDDDCGVGHKCCQSCCPSGQKRCLKVVTCP